MPVKPYLRYLATLFWIGSGLFWLYRWHYYIFDFYSFLSLLILVFGFLISLLYVLNAKFSLAYIAKISLFLSVICFCILCLESYFRFVEKSQYTWGELNFNQKEFFSSYEVLNTNTYLANPPGKSIEDWQNEFTYERTANSLGIFGFEPSSKDSSKLRILCFGDSFTQGVGAPEDSSWCASLEQNLNNLGISNEVVNAGLSGSDPIYAGLFFREVLWNAYQPDVVIFALNITDPYEVIIRGGEERVQADGTVCYRDAPWWEPIYATSHLARKLSIYLGFNGYLFKDSAENLAESREIIKSSFLNTYNFILKVNPNIKMFVIMHPMKEELAENMALSPTLESYNIEAPIVAIDLLPLMTQKVKAEDVEVNTLYWTFDKHHNSKGYWMMGNLIAQELKPHLSAIEHSK